MKQGLAFGEHIKFERVKRRRKGEPGDFRERGWFLLGVLVLVVVVLVFRVVWLQVFQGGYYRGLSDSNRIRSVVVRAPRGVIFDRNGVPLVFNVPGFTRVIRDGKTGGVKKLVHLRKEEALSFMARGDKGVVVDSLREYPKREALAHVLGYMGQISQEELRSGDFAGYGGDDWMGKDGIEQEYEKVLRGRDGKQLVEVDALGKQVRELGRTDPVPGRDVRLTIDGRLQGVVYEAMRDVRAGAVVVSKLDGEVLAMVSRPSFDPNLFTLDSSYRVGSESGYRRVEDILLDGVGQPLLNRAIGGVYPPGSTFKLVTAAAGLEDGVIDEHFLVEDTGVLKVGEFSYANWYFTQYGKKDGMVDVVKGLARSNDIFFYKLAEKVGVERLSEMARRFGLGKRLGVDLAGEAKGLVPSEEWKRRVMKEPWYLGDSFHYGIGQGYLLTTPLQVNVLTQVVANGGRVYRPRLNLNETQIPLTPFNKGGIPNQGFLSEETVEVIRRGMIGSCKEGGVAYPLYDFQVKSPQPPLIKGERGGVVVDGRDFYMPVASGSAGKGEVGVSVACKTGTAEHGGKETPPHAWITLFAPAYHPEVVVTVLVESGGEGSRVAAPIARRVLEGYFFGK